ncbi:hypothetical protein ABZ377_40700, partial [Streptomyces sp. NPDC005970]
KASMVDGRTDSGVMASGQVAGVIDATACRRPILTTNSLALEPRPQSPSIGSSSGRWPSEARAAAWRSAGTSP